MRKNRVVSVTYDKSCQRCGKDFISKVTTAKFCCVECRIENIVLQKSKDTGDEYVTCMLCNRAVFNVTGNHLSKYHPEYTSEMYRKEFPDSPVESKSTWERKRQGGINGGARMREPEMRKLFSELLKGENNPMHKSKTTDEERRAISPFSPDFYLKRDSSLTLDEAQKLAQDKTKEATDKIVSWTQVEYWTREGHTEEEAKAIISEKQKTFSLEICIEKYGEEAGLQRWKERQEKWIKNYKKNNFSLKSQELFVELWETIKNDFNDVFFATLDKNKELDVESGINHEFRLALEKKVMLPDFFIQSKNLIIEFDGVYWHDFNRRNKPENAKREKERDDDLVNSGYRILRVSEKDWDNNKQATIDRCIEFIYASNQENTEEDHSSPHQQN